MLGRVAFRAAVVAAVHLGKVLACFANSGLGSSKVSQVDSVLYIGQPATGGAVDLMIPVGLRDFIHVEPHRLVLLLKK